MSLDELFARCAELDGAALGDGAFAPGPAIWAGTREVAHVDADDALDIRLTKAIIRERRAELRADSRITLRASGSDWIEMRVQQADLDDAYTLISEAIAANLPTAHPGPPPTGADLERRRRFH